MKMRIAIIDFGMGNLRSIQYKLERAKINSFISSCKKDILASDKIIIPGVGHFATAMKNLHNLGLIDTLNKKIIDEIKISATPNFTSSTAYFFYNFAYSVFKPERVLILGT